MNLSQLYYFRHLAKVQHYTHAAEDLFITQPALSHAISQLEEELGCSLFEKQGRGIRLTEDGELFKTYVEEGLHAIDAGVEELRLRHGMVSGTVEVGAIATVRSSYLPSVIKAYRDECGPFVEFKVFQGETKTLAHQLEQGSYDMTITGPFKAAGITSVELFRQELAVIAPRSHPIAQKKAASFQDLIGYDVITYHSNLPVGEVLTAFLNDRHAPLEKMRLIRNYEDEVILGALALHEGVVALSLVTSNLPVDANMAIIPLAEPGAESFYPICLSYRTKGFLGAAAQKLVEFLETFEAPAYKHPVLKHED